VAWTNTQKQVAARACKAAGVSEEQRRDVILRHFRNARTPDGRITSTASKLSNDDFEQFMSIVEAQAGGQVLHFTRGYWHAKAADRWHRMRFRARRIAESLEAAGALMPDGAGLAGWIRKRVTKGETDQLDALDYHGLLALILSLTAYARQRGVDISPDTTDQADADRAPAAASASSATDLFGGQP
jgi:hypothetical protein